MFLILKAISKQYGDLTAVKPLDLEVIKGELLCLIGPSGCGKSTTIGMIGGFIPPSAGRIFLNNKEITDFPPHLREVSTVFQNYALFPHMSVIKNIIYGLKFKKISKKDALKQGERFMEMVGITHLKHENINHLSGGEQQRVALARSLILHPKILLLDEPLSNLDAKRRVHLRKEIKRIQAETKITMIYVTHDQDEAFELADRIAVMNKGEIIQTGVPETIYKNPTNIFVSDFFGRINHFTDKDGSIKMIRPESMKLSTKTGTYSGKIVHRQFNGAVVTYTVYVNEIHSCLNVDVLSSEDPHLKLQEFVYVS